MHKQNRRDKKYKLTHEHKDDDEEKQIEKTLNFFDSIIDPYLNSDDNGTDEKSERSKHDVNVSLNLFLYFYGGMCAIKFVSLDYKTRFCLKAIRKLFQLLQAVVKDAVYYNR